MATSEKHNFRLGVLVSGGGTNLQEIIDQCQSGRLPACVSVVVGNNSSSGALRRAKKENIPVFHLSSWTHPDPSELDRKIRDVLQFHKVNLVLLAGYVKKIGPLVLREFQNRILNIHPGLLPAFGGKGMYGLRVHEAVIASGARISGVTIHLVNEEYDQGAIIAQEVLKVDPEDTPESLSQKVLEIEHWFFPKVIRLFAKGMVKIKDRNVKFSNECEELEVDS